MKEYITKIKKLKRKIIKKPVGGVEVALNFINTCYNQGLDDAIKILATPSSK